MTNREWLLNQMQNMSDEELFYMVNFKCNDWGIKSERNCSDKTCNDCFSNWLKSEHKEPITLSEAERIILENIDKEYKWIIRDEDEALRIFEEKPKKLETLWGNSKSFENLNAFNHLFQFITWEDEQPYNIEELLKCGD